MDGSCGFCWDGRRLLLIIIIVLIIAAVFFVGEEVSSIFPPGF